MKRPRATGIRAWAGPGNRLLGAVATLLLLVGPVRAQSSDKLPEPGGRSIEALLAQKAQRTSAQRKVSSQLLDAAGGTQPPADGAARRRAPDPGVADELVTVDIRADVTPAVLARIRALGGTVLSSLPRYRAIRARLPLAAVEKLATLDAVQFIRPADEAITNQSLERSAVARTTGAGNERNTSEGDVAHRADKARETHDVDGTGIGIGVLSNGVDTLAERQATGDLPARVTVLAGQTGEGDEGTAMLEIVHDLAPGAELYFATILGGQAQFAANIEALCAAGADVIVDDAIYPIEPAFQDGIVAQAINAAVADDCVYFSMAGNGGNLSSYSGRRAGVWEGDYAAGSALVVSGETVGVRHDFDSGPGVAVENPVTRDSEHEFVLQWADPLGASANDYDLFLVDNNGNVLDSSTTTQDGTQDPIESIRSRRINHLGDRLVIVKVSGEDRYLRLNNVGAWFTSVTAGQTFGHNAASNAITVAAVNVTTAGGEGGVFNGTESVEWFSSDGPRRIFFRPDGAAITPSDFSSSGGQLLQKPDLTAADRVSTATPGFETFPGTSAAAPHAAAIAALMLEAAGGPTNVTLDELRKAMTDTALNIGDTGADRDSGAGIVMAPGAVEAVAVADRNGVPEASGTLASQSLAPGGATATIGVASAFTDPDSHALTYTALSDNTAVVTTSVAGSRLTLTSWGPGEAKVTVRATDPEGLSAIQIMSVTVVWGDEDYDADDDNLIEVGTLAQLDAMRHDLNGDGVVDSGADAQAYYAAFSEPEQGMGCADDCYGYELTEDLDFDTNKNGRADAGDAYWNGGAGWNPIRGRIISSFGLHLITSGFAATFEGNGHTIANLYINRNVTAVGLFGAAYSRAIRNVGIVNANVTGQSSVGALAGIKLGDLSGSYATGRVSGQDGVGGLVGSHRGSIAASYATTQVSGQNNVGGLIGSNYLGTVIACYATGRVSGTANVGGLVGLNSSDDEVIASYATGHVSGVSNVGGLIGDNQGTASNSYWDMSTSGQTTGTAGQTTAQLQSPTDYSGMYADWNVDLDGGGTADDPWDFGLSDEYPVLAVDFDGNEDVTWKEFGYQLRAGPTLMATPGAGEVALRWNAVDTDPWNPSPPDVTYTVYRKTDATITVLAQGISGTTYTDTGVSIGSTYTYQVAAVVEGGEATRSALVMVTAPNHPPTFLSSEDGMRTVAEKTGENVNIGDPVKATDPDDPTLTYSLGGPDAASFTITERTGQLRTKAELDHETQPLYSVTVRVSDGKDVDGTADPTVDATIPVTLTVTDAPGTVTLPSTPPLVGTMLQATLTDPDGLGSSATWKWERSRDQSVWTLIRETSTGEPANSYTPVATDINEYLRVTVQYTDGHETPDKEAGSVSQRVSARRPPPPPPPGPGPGGGGGGPACTEDDVHGNTAATATDIALSAVTAGAICPAADVDYFTVTAPGRGLLFVDTPRGVPTRGTIWQDGMVLASGPTGRQPDDRLGARVQAGSVVVAVQGQGGAIGTYAVEITLVQGTLENPGADSFQSGVGVLSGWVCEAAVVELELNGIPQEAAYGTERLDTAGVCGDTDNGFGLLFNWNLLGDGEHTVVAWVDGAELGRASVTVTILGAEFLRGVTGTCEAGDFPTLGERVTLVWQQNSQNFVIAGGSPPAGATTGRTSALMGFLENPGPNSFQSGVGVLSGWVCDADRVEIEIGAAGRQVAAYGTERLDTAGGCGDTDNGFGLLFNWNLLGDGEHTVVAFVDGVELGRATVRVATLGEEFLREAEGECTVTDFPVLGETVTLEWQQNSQNFVITAVE